MQIPVFSFSARKFLLSYTDHINLIYPTPWSLRVRIFSAFSFSSGNLKFSFQLCYGTQLAIKQSRTRGKCFWKLEYKFFQIL